MAMEFQKSPRNYNFLFNLFLRRGTFFASVRIRRQFFLQIIEVSKKPLKPPFYFLIWIQVLCKFFFRSYAMRHYHIDIFRWNFLCVEHRVESKKNSQFRGIIIRDLYVWCGSKWWDQNRKNWKVFCIINYARKAHLQKHTWAQGQKQHTTYNSGWNRQNKYAQITSNCSTCQFSKL